MKKLIEEIKEKNRIRLVTATFRNKFLREPNATELSSWTAIFEADGDFQRFLTKINLASANSQPVSDTVFAAPHLVDPAALFIVPINIFTQRNTHLALGVRASVFYELMQPKQSHVHYKVKI